MPSPNPHALPPGQPTSSLARFADLAFRDRAPRVAVAPPAVAAPPLLTHHQIVELAAPFARHGHAVDLAASDRLHRRLVFHSIRHRPPVRPGAAGDGEQASRTLQETLQLESPSPGYFRLTRTVSEDGGLQATLQAAGARPADLLAWVQAVPLQRHFHTGPGYRMARSGWTSASHAADAGFQMTHAQVQTDALNLNVSMSSSSSSMATSAAVDIQPRHPGDALPADLLAVLGWDWSLLQTGLQGWQGSVRLRGTPLARGHDAQHKLRMAAAHLVRTLAEPPRRFHERLRSARLWVVARHAIPLLACALLASGVLFADALRDARASPLTLVLLCIPPGLLLLFMLRSERPRLALPTWPRSLATHAWGAAR